MLYDIVNLAKQKMCKNIKTIYGENLWENSKFCLRTDIYFKQKIPRRYENEHGRKVYMYIYIDCTVVHRYKVLISVIYMFCIVSISCGKYPIWLTKI